MPAIERSGLLTTDIEVLRLHYAETVRKKSRSDRLRSKPEALGRRAVLRLDRAQSTAGKGLRGHHRLRTRLPLRRIRHVARASARLCFMTFETDSKAKIICPHRKWLRRLRTLPNRYR
jgi:hypothetical protein